jgi:hypothetical protein
LGLKLPGGNRGLADAILAGFTKAAARRAAA